MPPQRPASFCQPRARNRHVHARVDPDVKRNAETVLTAAGLTTGQAIRALLTRIAADGRLPFDIFAVTDAEIEQARRALADSTRFPQTTTTPEALPD